MVGENYAPDAGHIVWLEFSPQAGHEQSGRRPGLVLSPRSYNEKTNLALFYPITSRVKGYPFEVLLPSSVRIRGAVLSDRVRSLDWRAHWAKFEERVPPQTVREVKEKLSVLLR